MIHKYFAENEFGAGTYRHKPCRRDDSASDFRLFYNRPRNRTRTKVVPGSLQLRNPVEFIPSEFLHSEMEDVGILVRQYARIGVATASFFLGILRLSPRAMRRSQAHGYRPPSAYTNFSTSISIDRAFPKLNCRCSKLAHGPKGRCSRIREHFELLASGFTLIERRRRLWAFHSVLRHRGRRRGGIAAADVPKTVAR